MKIEIDNKAVIAVLAIIIAGGAVFAGYKAINKNISQEGSETRKDLAGKADKKDIADMAINLEAKITQFNSKMDEMNKQMTTAQAATATTTPATAATTAGTVATTTTTSTSAEEELLKELEDDIDNMKDTQKDAIDSLDDINDSIESLTGAVGAIAASTGSIASDLSVLVALVAQAQAKAHIVSNQAQQTIDQYGEKVVANQNVLTARQDLLGATVSGNAQAISGAESKLVSTLNTDGSKLSPAFAQQYFKQMPASFGKISGMDSALGGIKVEGTKFNFSKMNFSRPSSSNSGRTGGSLTGGTRSFDGTLER